MTQDDAGLNTLWGVFLPCLQNILGVILFIRLPFIAGQAGVFLTMGVIGACVTTTLLTALSLSAIATNGRIPAGGPYYVISRNLGAPMGGAIGLLFYLGTVLGATMYVLGAVEAIQTGFGVGGLFPFDTQVLALGIMLLLAGVVFVGVEFVSAVAPLFLGVVIASIALGVTGVSLFAAGEEFGDSASVAAANSTAFGPEFVPDPDTGVTPSFVSLLALFYPSVTGIMAGANRSGVLANPARSIPLGTLAAIATTTTLYLGVTWLYGAFVAREELLEDKLIFATLAWPVGIIVNVGIVMSSLGAGLQSLTGAPQLLAVMRRDGVVPSLPLPQWLGGGKAAAAVPPGAAGDDTASQAGTREIVTTWLLASLPCLAGNIDNITPVQTMFFLMMYAAINAACLLLTLVKAPNFRPAWKYYSAWTCAAGILTCAAIMLLVSWWQALVVVTLAVLLHHWIRTTGEGRQWGTWGDSLSALRLAQATSALLALRTVPMHPKNWRPQLLVLAATDDSGVPTRPGLLHVAGQLKRGQGLTIVASVKEGRLLSVLNRARERYRTLLGEVGGGAGAGETAARLLATGATSASPSDLAAALAAPAAVTGTGNLCALTNDPETIRLAAPQAALQRAMLAAGVDGFSQVLFSPSPAEGLLMLLQTAGLAALAPNMLLLGWPDGVTQWSQPAEGGPPAPALTDRRAATAYVGLLKTSLALRKSITVVRGEDDPVLSSPEPMRGSVDIWWVRVDSGLLLLLPWLLTRHPKWAACKLRLFAVVSGDAVPGQVKARLEEYLRVQRIVAEVFTVRVAAEVADAAVANRTLDLEARAALAEAHEASTMTMAAAPATRPRSPSRRSVADVWGGGSGGGGAAGGTITDAPPPLAPLVEGPPSAAHVSGEEEQGGEEGAVTPAADLAPAASVPPELASRAARLRSAMALNAAMTQHSSEAALVVTNLFVSRSVDVKTFVLESELLMAGIPRALLVRGTGGELVTSFEQPPDGFVGQAERPAALGSLHTVGVAGAGAEEEEEGDAAPLSPARGAAAPQDVALELPSLASSP